MHQKCCLNGIETFCRMWTYSKLSTLNLLDKQRFSFDFEKVPSCLIHFLQVDFSASASLSCDNRKQSCKWFFWQFKSLGLIRINHQSMRFLSQQNFTVMVLLCVCSAVMMKCILIHWYMNEDLSGQCSQLASKSMIYHEEIDLDRFSLM